MLNLNGEYRVPAGREQVWALLNDPDVLGACIPGCEEISREGDDAFTAKVVIRIGPVKARFGGAVKLEDKIFPESYRISGEGQGGIAGFAKGGANVRLVADGADVTVLIYEVDAQIGGKLAQLGSRLIASTSKKLADQFFGKFCEIAASRAYA